MNYFIFLTPLTSISPFMSAIGIIISLFSSQHMNAVHLKDRPYHCDECGYAAATKGLVQKHVSTVHRKEKPYACEICNSRFGQKVRVCKPV